MRRHDDPPISRVLVGTDGSPNGEEAVRQAARLAAIAGADLDAICVLDRASIVPHSGESLAREIARADAALDEAARLADKEGVEVQTARPTGAPAATLMREARLRWADLLVVGADAGLRQKPRIMGRVAAQLLRECDTSTLIARVPRDPDGARFPKRILCGVDGSDDALEAVRVAAWIAADGGGELDLLHVIGVERSSRVGWSASVRDPSPGDPLDPAVALAREAGIAPHARRILGEPGPGMVEQAKAAETDLLVMGSRGLHGLRRALLGSVSGWAAHHAPCSVLVVHPRPG